MKAIDILKGRVEELKEEIAELEIAIKILEDCDDKAKDKKQDNGDFKITVCRYERKIGEFHSMSEAYEPFKLDISYDEFEKIMIFKEYYQCEDGCLEFFKEEL